MEQISAKSLFSSSSITRSRILDNNIYNYSSHFTSEFNVVNQRRKMSKDLFQVDRLSALVIHKLATSF